MNVSIETRPATTVYGIRHVGPYQEIGPAYQRLWGWVLASDLASQVRGSYGIYHDNPTVTPPAQCRADACVELASDAAPKDLGPVERITIAGGRHARYRHVGAYAGLAQAYQVLNGWLPTSGYEHACAPSFEVYVNDPQYTPEDQLITDIYVPLKG